MDTRIRLKLLELLRSSPTWNVQALVPMVAKALEADPDKVHHVLRLMEDAGEAEVFGHGYDGVRITLKGEQAASPPWQRFKTYMINYLATHWLAVIATVISLIALFKK